MRTASKEKRLLAGAVTPNSSRERVGASTKKRRVLKHGVADLSPVGCPIGAPTCSEGTKTGEPRERSAMRNVALDLGARKTTYCEVTDGQVVRRATVAAVETLKSLLGP